MSTSEFNIKDYSIEEIMDSIGEDTIHLYLSNSSYISLDILKQIGSKCPNLSYLYLHACDIYADDNLSEGLKYIADGCPLLKLIDLSAWNINVKELGYLVSSCNSLEYIILIQCRQVTDDYIKIISQYCNNLTYLDISVCTSITDNSLKYLSEGCRELKTLHLHGGPLGNNNLTNIGLSYLANNCKKLERMVIAYFPNISNVGINNILDGCDNIDRDNIDIRGIY
jgi:F-box/leucine-rich repeat protein 7